MTTISRDEADGYWASTPIAGVAALDAPRVAATTESALSRFIRRVLEVTLATTGLIVTAPLMLLIAIVIRLDSPGPALFWQTRMGRDRRAGGDRRRHERPVPGAERRSRDRRRRDMAGRPFTFVKFRTMYVDARQRFPELYRYRYTEEEIRTMKFKLDPDPRLTRVGRVLRKTSLDELPNLWNVLTGGIALVGPRPEIPEMTPYYTEQQRLKFRVRPGVTGLAQIHGRGRLTFQETVGWDVEYVRRRSLGADVSILWQTAIAVMRRDGAF